ncbi:MAG: 50S ribosome-binding GTPase [Deltaproteobacteria bacterium]|uniref:50S ribosome-binding GTPase n=1 Tax=Candidatus Zymogenus saltonus TaxID=2844893 RepID=A0A9D8KFI4_9DELT|nr:50S ribosome-binding GTPase [Candidatus Zymogenus saltonus]
MLEDIINIVFAGHVDHGKSTLVGRIFYECGQIPDQMFERLQRHADAVGKSSFHFAFYTDSTLEERQRGISIEVAYKGFERNGRRYNIIDVPGHKDFIKNMISGTAEADIAVLVIDAKETSNSGAAPQTREHLLILRALGIENMIVAVNKMDTVGYSEESFELCKMEIEHFCERIQYSFKEDIRFIPISALYGDNVAQHTENPSWYQGPTLLEVLDSIPKPERPVEKPLRMPILRTFSVTGIGTVVAGRIETGTIQPKDEVVITPYPGVGVIQAEIKSIEWQHKSVDSAAAGDDVGVLLTKQEKGFAARKVKKGSVLASPVNPPRAAGRFKAEIMLVDHPSGIRAGYVPYLHVHQAAMPCSISEIVTAWDPQGEEKKLDDDTLLKNGDTAVVWIVPTKPLVIEEANVNPRLGNFILRDGRTVAIGKCLEVELADI